MKLEKIELTALKGYVGRELGVSGWLLIDQARIDCFADCTGDHQWIHVDPERARRESPYGTTIAHGYLTLSLVAQTTFEVLVAPLGLTRAINYGIDRARFLTPIKAGSQVRNRIHLVAVEDKGGGCTLLTTRNCIEVDGQDKPALIADTLVMAIGTDSTPAQEIAK